MSEQTLLTDTQVQEFICNGFLRLNCGLPREAHRTIESRLRWVVEHEFAMGNNILPRVPEMYAVLDSPVVRGALTSLLGPRNVLHPHRALHISTPVEDKSLDVPIDADGPPMGRGSMAGSGWHQDAQSPLSRARHHVPRYLILFYFPHDTPPLMGPTRVEAGSHLYSRPMPPRHPVLAEGVDAGTVFVVHFDLVHAAFPNRTDTTRLMVKFVAARTTHPAGPTWHSTNAAWRRPAACIPDVDLPRAWSGVWRWMRGEPVAPYAGPRSVTSLLEGFGETDQARRLESIYGLAGMGAAAIDALSTRLEDAAGRGRDERRLATGKDGRPIPRDDLRVERRWTERAVVMEDAAYALGAAGPDAVPALRRLLRHRDPWVKINAAFAAGEIGPGAAVAVPELTEALRHPSQHVVRQALDALAAIGRGLGTALPEIERLLTRRNAAWQAAEVMRQWTGEDQVRLNAAFALLNAIAVDTADTPYAAAIERLCTLALGDRNGYVALVAAEALSRIRTETARDAAIAFLKRQAWDPSLAGALRVY